MEEQSAGFSSFLHTLSPQKKMLLIGGGAILVATYIAVNVGLWRYAKVNQQKEQSANVADQLIEFPSDNSSFSKPFPSLTPTPTPRPTGPGQYACSAIGTCKDFDDAKRKEKCPVTYADMYCLDQCGDATKRCAN